MIAALFVQSNGCYSGIEGVDPWDQARDARKYAGPWPVVAHPPCDRWSLMANCRRQRDGQDDGCFASALASVRRWGGVLEHPAHSLAWDVFGLSKPLASGWTRDLSGGWTCEVDQGHYGHRSRKPTWLYYIGDAMPPVLAWGKSPAPNTSGYYGGGRAGKSDGRRAATPIPFRELLLSMARSVPSAIGKVG